ncbi:MAG: acetoacetate--CoA ligase [Paracoccaceae bacterium]
MIAEGQLLWQASEARKAGLNLTQFIGWLNARGHDFTGYAELYAWSIADLAGFWGAVRDYFGLILEGEADPVLTDALMPRTRWLPCARLNYAEHVLRHEGSGDPGRVMLHHVSELRPMAEMSWAEVGGAVRKLATRLRAMGIGPGDRVVAYMPNLPETVIAMLATTAIGAVWSSAAPEFGAQTVIDRFSQIAPKLVFAVNGYRYGGKDFDRRADLERILAALPTVETVVMLDYLPGAGVREGATPWEALLDGPDVPREGFEFARVDGDHPLWVLFTSGTTGLPKPITHGHHGIVLEHLKTAAFHYELKEGQALLCYSTTGWMVWNTLMMAPLMNGRSVLYDGHPSFPDARRMWQIAEATRASVFATSPTFVQMVRGQGIDPGKEFSLPALETLLLVGSPATPETFDWAHRAVKADLWVTSHSGGTEFCSGTLAGSPLLPTRAGEIQAPALGVDVRALSDEGEVLVDAEGELAILRPMPSMPIYLWGDSDFARYLDSYFDTWPGIWRHGDRLRMLDHGGSFVLGRSDATLNRYGVRIGSAEVYRTLEGIAGVADSLIICVEDGKGGFWMPLFVAMAKGAVLDEAKRAEIVRRLRVERSPRHVPDEIVEVPEVPVTLTGKKMEVPVRKLMLGIPLAKAASRDAARNPGALDWFADLARKRLG